jgi:hypothetical protein
MATEERLVDANELVAEFEWLQSQVSSERAMELQDYVQRIKDAPTVDAVPVVRCKACKYCDPESLHCDHPMGTTFPFPRKIDDFCSYGERKSR